MELHLLEAFENLEQMKEFPPLRRDALAFLEDTNHHAMRYKLHECSKKAAARELILSWTLILLNACTHVWFSSLNFGGSPIR